MNCLIFLDLLQVGVKFFKGLDGSDYYCKWCGDGGKLFCCSKCPAVFCAKCVKINFSAADVEEIEQDDNWLCFLCNKDTLRLHRARHWALQNFMKKQENFMLNKTMTKSQIRNAMAKDLSTCCPSPKRLGATGVRPLSVSPGRKRTAPSGPSKRSKRSQSTSQGCGVRPLSVSPGRKRTAPSGPSKRPQRSQSESQGSSSMSLRSTTPVRTNPSAPPNTPLKSILSNKRLMLNHPTFFRVATDECDAITGVLNICQNTINEIISLDTNLAPETESRLNVLCTSLQYLNNYTADLMKKHKANITNEWEQTRK